MKAYKSAVESIVRTRELARCSEPERVVYHELTHDIIDYDEYDTEDTTWSSSYGRSGYSYSYGGQAAPREKKQKTHRKVMDLRSSLTHSPPTLEAFCVLEKALASSSSIAARTLRLFGEPTDDAIDFALSPYWDTWMPFCIEVAAIVSDEGALERIFNEASVVSHQVLEKLKGGLRRVWLALASLAAVKKEVTRPLHRAGPDFFRKITRRCLYDIFSTL
jgi:hypothetical protein